ncbi:adenylate kinase [Nocardia sp. XZ_19_385]|uniref:adenylate kinase n=1 Tax=Nocardia sp. XZ_19_385 TaxID=2769488 RepID=UPI0018902246|nr:adenylate kinase [Nocardia sp. XZ_19_385]
MNNAVVPPHRRISVVGTSGSGKSSLARRISEQLGIPHIELDAIHHQADWTPLPTDEFQAAVTEQVTRPAWVADGNYHGKLGDLVWRHADTVLWFDLPRPQVMLQIIKRTAGRILTARELWNGNRENPRNMFSLNPERSVIMWAWTTHARNRTRYTAAHANPAYQHLDFIHIRSHRDAEHFLTSLTQPVDNAPAEPRTDTPQS